MLTRSGADSLLSRQDRELFPSGDGQTFFSVSVEIAFSFYSSREKAIYYAILSALNTKRISAFGPGERVSPHVAPASEYPRKLGRGESLSRRREFLASFSHVPNQRRALRTIVHSGTCAPELRGRISEVVQDYDSIQLNYPCQFPLSADLEDIRKKFFNNLSASVSSSLCNILILALGNG